METGKVKSFNIKGLKQEEIFDGNKLFGLNLSDNTYRVSANTENSLYFHRSMSYLINDIEESIKKTR